MPDRRPTVACCWCWCGARLRLTPGPPPSPGHGAACRSDCGWCPPSAPARGKAPKHEASWQAYCNSAAEVHQGGSSTPGSSAQQHAQGLCMCVQPQGLFQLPTPQAAAAVEAQEPPGEGSPCVLAGA
uniref:Uncharacterized protein n=1 Tax=Tetradesmus obliquus TaxID=3088 RepID=A0A383W4T2_TETOB